MCDYLSANINSPDIDVTPGKIVHPDLFASLFPLSETEGQVIIHGYCAGGLYGLSIRIWPTTYLFDCHSAHQSSLVYFENISGFPHWTQVLPGDEYTFTLVFTALPASCVLFDLKEIIPQSHGFEVVSIPRNDTDVYYIDFSG